MRDIMEYIKMEREIPEDDYNKLVQSPKKDVDDYILNIAYKSTFHPCGYGFYSPVIYKEDGKCYASWRCYDSCD